jgi:L-malate glycosyltransferase
LGLPIIGGGHSGGVPWQLNFGRAGKLSDINNPNEISNAIKHLLRNQEVRRSLGEAAKRRSLDIFNPSSICDTWDHLYEKVINTWKH